MNRARNVEFERGWFSGGIKLYPYQVGIGASVSFWPCIKRPEISVYIGPFRLWLGVSGSDVFAFAKRLLASRERK